MTHPLLNRLLLALAAIGVRGSESYKMMKEMIKEAKNQNKSNARHPNV
jgi:hypothetical protein